MRRRELQWALLAVHLSRLAASASRPHHARIAKAVLNEAAGERGGQLFRMPQGDFLLLVPAPDGGAGLLSMIGNLFAADAPDPNMLLSKWLLPVDLAQLDAYLDAVPAIASPAPDPDQDAELALAARLCGQITPAVIGEFAQRQTGVLLTVGGASRLLALFRELSVPVDHLALRPDAAPHRWADPFLHRHMANAVSEQLLDRVLDDVQDSAERYVGAGAARPALHLNLGVGAIPSPGFDRLCTLAKAHQLRVGIEIPLVEALADADAFAAARERIRAEEFTLVLDDVNAHAFALTRLAALGADMLKLGWSALVPHAGAGLDRAIDRFGPNRILLANADSEQAVRWGVARGIRRFQGRHVDAMLAAARLAACPGAAGCTLRQCAEREAATTAAGRAGCSNLPLLDAATPSSLALQ